MSTPKPASQFDSFADDYDEALNEGLSVSGEDRMFFARSRVNWLSAKLVEIGQEVRSIMDYGCGTGASVPLLLELKGAGRVLGVDTSSKSLEVARRAVGSKRATFQHISESRPSGDCDLVFCNGVFHHIEPELRSEALRDIFTALRPGGILAFWENNPWNPGTRYVMKRIPFDHDAKTLSARVATVLLREAGFEIMRRDFLFIFPRFLSLLRWAEPWLASWPLGAQYLVLGRKPLEDSRK